MTAERPTEGFATEGIAEFTVAFSETLSSLMTGNSDVRDTLDLVLTLATTIDGCDFAGVFLMQAGEVTTVATTNPVVGKVDDYQLLTAEGPCLDAMASEVAFYADDLSDDSRWPEFGPAAAASGTRSLLALPLRLTEAPGALNLYASDPDAFDTLDRGNGALLAAIAGMALRSAQTHEDDARRTQNLENGLATREIIGQAQGILMERERITAREAFRILARASQHLNVKLKDVAQNLVDTGEAPDADV